MRRNWEAVSYLELFPGIMDCLGPRTYEGAERFLHSGSRGAQRGRLGRQGTHPRPRPSSLAATLQPGACPGQWRSQSSGEPGTLWYRIASVSC